MDNNYMGDMILIPRLSEFFSVEHWSWNVGEIVTINDITCAIYKGQLEELKPFSDGKTLYIEKKSTKWHIGRILYFIKHQEEIRDIEIDNLYVENYVFPIPTILDGNHRFMAAMWLHNKGKINKVHCKYGGRLDLLDYLTGKVNECPNV